MIYYGNGLDMNLFLETTKKKRKKMNHKNKKLELAYRYSLPLQWILDKLEDGKGEEITMFDVLNAKHELDTLLEGWHFPPEESEN